MSSIKISKELTTHLILYLPNFLKVFFLNVGYLVQVNLASKHLIAQREEVDFKVSMGLKSFEIYSH